MNTRIVILATLLAAMAACSSTPDRNSAIEKARTDFRMIESDSEVATLAADELEAAAEALRTAEAAWSGKDSRINVDHLAYLSIQHSAIARQTAEERSAQAAITGASSERDRMMLQARTDQASAAQRQASLSQQEAARSDARRISAQAETARAQQALAESRQDTARSDAEAVAARAAADRSQQQATNANIAAANATRRSDASDARAETLEAQLSELNAKPSPRGMVVTLGDVLFATGASQIIASVGNSLEPLAAFMKGNPEQTASIEGYTDSVGDSSYNYSLSQMRADAVRTRLIAYGANPDRLTTRAFGPESPVASNGTETGRQMNRRVEIVFPQ